MKALKSIPLFVAAVLLSGCDQRILSLESNHAIMTPNPPASGKTLDPYTNGGIADATGGTQPLTSYATSTPAPATLTSTAATKSVQTAPKAGPAPKAASANMRHAVKAKAPVTKPSPSEGQ